MTDVVGRGVIEVDIDPSGIKAGVAEGKRSLADLTQAAEQSGQRAAKGIENIGAGGDRAAQKIERSTKSIISSIQRQIAIMEAGSNTGSKYFEAIAKQRGVSVETLRPYLQQLDAVNTANKRLGQTAGQTANALRILPAQITDISVGLATGQSPLMVLLQQGGQLKDMFGGIGPAAKAVGGYVLGLVNPFTIAAAAIGAVAVAYKQGSDEQTAFVQSLAQTGNIAGVTSQQLATYAERVSGQVGTTHEAAKVLAQLVATGQIYGAQLEGNAKAVIEWSHATGISTDQVVKNFADLARDPVGASLKLNTTLHYLTLSTYEQIRALEAQGREQEASALAQKIYARAVEEAGDEVRRQLGSIERAWDDVGKVAAKAWDKMRGVGRERTLDDLKSELESLNRLTTASALDTSRLGVVSGDLNEQRKQQLQREIADREAKQAAAEQAAIQQRKNELSIASEQYLAKLRDSTLSNAEKREKEIAEIRRNAENIRSVNPNSPSIAPENMARLEQNVRDKYKDPEFKLDSYRQMQVEMQNMADKALEGGDIMRQVAKDNEEYINRLVEGTKKINDNFKGVEDFLKTDEERLRESYDRRLAMLDDWHLTNLDKEDKYQEIKNKLIEKYDEDARKMQAQKTSELLGNYSSLFDSFAGIAEAAGGRQSAAYRALFAVSKAFAVAKSIVAIQTGIAEAAANPWPANLAAMASVVASTASIVSTIRGTNIDGVAHGGIDNIPREGTWLLNGGERVVAPQQNRDLTRFLSNQSTTNNNQRSIVMNVYGVQDVDGFRRSRRQLQDEMRKVANS